MAMVEVTTKRDHRCGGARKIGDKYMLPAHRVAAHVRQGLIEDPNATAPAPAQSYAALMQGSEEERAKARSRKAAKQSPAPDENHVQD